MSLEGRKVVYSTATRDAEKEKRLNRQMDLAIKVEMEKTSREIKTFFQHQIDLIQEDDPKNIPIVLLGNFMYFWYDKLKAYILEGRDIVAEKDPKNSIFRLWGKEHNRVSDGYHVCVRIPGEERDINGNPYYKFHLVVRTPGLALEKDHVDAFDDIPFAAIATDITKTPFHTLAHAKKEELIKDIDGIYEHHYNEGNGKVERNKLITEWKNVFKILDEYVAKYGVDGFPSPNDELNPEVKESIKEDAKKKARLDSISDLDL